MKTVKEWLEMLPEPYRTQALNNVNLRDDIKIRFKPRLQSLVSAIECSFAWVKTPEGYEYWRDVCEKIISGEIKPVDK